MTQFDVMAKTRLINQKVNQKVNRMPGKEQENINFLV